MEKKTIIVTGANGQLGRELQVLAPSFPELEFVFADRSQLPIEDSARVLAFFQQTNPAWCINCAAYTAVDKAESEKEAAFHINGDAPGYLAAACRTTGARLIHVSTDYVFDGESATPLKENDPTGPKNVYGASKLNGEHQVMDQYPEGSIIIRTSWVYSEFGANFVKTMIRLMKERPSINVVNDQIGSPTYAGDLAGAILHIITGGRFVAGIYHYSNEGTISWYDFAVAIRDGISSTCVVEGIPSSEYPTPARRPHYSLLNKNLIKETFGVAVPEWKTSLGVCLSRLSF